MEFHDRMHFRFTICVDEKNNRVTVDKDESLGRKVMIKFEKEKTGEYRHHSASIATDDLKDCAEIAERLIDFQLKNYYCSDIEDKTEQFNQLIDVEKFLKPFRGVLAEFVLWEQEKYAIRVLQSLLAEKDMRCFAPLFMDLARTLKDCPGPDEKTGQQVSEQFKNNLIVIVKHEFDHIKELTANLFGYTKVCIEMGANKKKKA